jgi:hypothetical protein
MKPSLKLTRLLDLWRRPREPDREGADVLPLRAFDGGDFFPDGISDTDFRPVGEVGFFADEGDVGFFADEGEVAFFLAGVDLGDFD